MDTRRYLCERCGGAKRLFFVRGPWRIVVSVALLVVVGALWLYLPDETSRYLLIYFGIGISLVPAISLLRIRCLVCEPE